MVMTRKKPKGDPADDRWHGRPVLSGLVSGAVFVRPHLRCPSWRPRSRPTSFPGLGPQAGWQGGGSPVLVVPTVVLLATDRLARRAMPLAVLLKMTMVFPDRAPKRLAVVRKSGSTRNLARRVEEARTHGIEDEPVVAAEKILALAGALNAHDRSHSRSWRTGARLDRPHRRANSTCPPTTATACVGPPSSMTSASSPFTPSS